MFDTQIAHATATATARMVSTTRSQVGMSSIGLPPFGDFLAVDPHFAWGLDA